MNWILCLLLVAVVVGVIYSFSARNIKRGDREHYDEANARADAGVEYIQNDGGDEIEMIPHDDAADIYSVI